VTPNQASPLTQILTPIENLIAVVGELLTNSISSLPISGSQLPPELSGVLGLIKNVLSGLSAANMGMADLANEGDTLVINRAQNASNNPSNATFEENLQNFKNGQIKANTFLLNSIELLNEQLANLTLQLGQQLAQAILGGLSNPANLLNNILSVLGNYINALGITFGAFEANLIYWFQYGLADPGFPAVGEYFGSEAPILLASTLQGIYNLAVINVAISQIFLALASVLIR